MISSISWLHHCASVYCTRVCGVIMLRTIKGENDGALQTPLPRYPSASPVKPQDINPRPAWSILQASMARTRTKGTAFLLQPERSISYDGSRPFEVTAGKI